MVDITKCMGTNDVGDICVVRDSCYRYTSPPDVFLQVYFVASPWFNNGCEMFWDRDNDIHGYRFGDNNQESGKSTG